MLTGVARSAVVDVHASTNDEEEGAVGKCVKADDSARSRMGRIARRGPGLRNVELGSDLFVIVLSTD